MKDCPLTTSDWFAYFQDYRHYRASIALAKAAFMSPLIIFFLSFNFISGNHAEILNKLDNNIPIPLIDVIMYIAIFCAACVCIIVLFLILKKEDHCIRLADDMIKEIIDGENDSNKIRNEWLERIDMSSKKRKSIFDSKNFDYDLYANVFFYLGFAFLLIGVIFSVINFFGIKAFDIAAVFFTGGLALLSISLAWS